MLRAADERPSRRTQLIQELIAEDLHAVPRYRPQSDKVMRLHAQTAMIENGFVHLPKEAPWLGPYFAQLTAFPRGKHDDQVELDRPNARLVQGGRPRAWRLLPILQGSCPRAAEPSARAAIGDREAAGPPSAVTRQFACQLTSVRLKRTTMRT